MIEIGCCTAQKAKLSENAVGKKSRCPACGRVVQLVAGETIAEGAGDFDAELVADEGSSLPVARYVLGGCADISIGKLATCQIQLLGQQVSRQHCKLVRVDFGPSRWKIVDQNSTNGVFVNGQRVTDQELVDGDALSIGGFAFHYVVQGWAQDADIPPLPEFSEPMASPSRQMDAAYQNTSRSTAPGSNSMATASLVLGILICMPLCSLLAIVFSIFGLRRANKIGGAGQSKALAGLVLGIVGIVAILPMLWILLPSLNRAREIANRVECAHNLQMISIALKAYSDSYHGNFPSSLDDLVSTENLPAKCLSCPDAPDDDRENYVLAAQNSRISANSVVVYEPIANHNDGINILYGDGRIIFTPKSDALPIIASLQNPPNSSSDDSAAAPQSSNSTPHQGFGSQRDNVVNAVPDGDVRTDVIGLYGGNPYLEVNKDRRTVIGFAISIGQWSGHQTIGDCHPLYAAPTGPAPDNTTYCLANDGYVVGGIIVNKSNDPQGGADGLQIIFTKMTDNSIDLNDTYRSPWFGYTGDSTQTLLAAGPGQRVIGTIGRQGNNMNMIGLVLDPGQSSPQN